MALALVLAVVGMVATAAGLFSAFISIPVTALAVLLMFGIKSGIAVRFIRNETNPLISSVYIAFAVTLITTLGSFGFLALTMQHADIRAAFFKTYGIFPEIEKQSSYSSRTGEMYSEYFGNLVRYVKMWGYLMLRDGLLFFAATVLLLYLQQRKSRSLVDSMLSGILVWMFGLLVFAFIIYGDDFMERLPSMDLPELVAAVVGYVRKESLSAYDLVMIAFGQSKYATFDAWFQDELVKMAGSIFKMVSIYPKLCIVFLVFSLFPNRTAQLSGT